MRRRKKNTLLPKMIAVAVVINAILLPILAKLGAFKTRGQMLVPIKLIQLPPEKKPKVAQNQKKKQVAKAHPRSTGRQIARGPVRVNANQVHIGLSKTASTEGNGAAQGTLAPGTIPQAPAQPAAPPTVPTPAPAPSPAPAPVAVQPQPAPVAPPAPVIVDAQVLDKPPLPTLPEDLLGADMNTSCTVLLKVHADGDADASIAQGTGNDEADRIALDYAKRWTFRPATENGTPVDSYLRVRVDFNVS